MKQQEVHLHTHDRAAGVLRLEQATVRWFLSINGNTLPEEVRKAGKSTSRAITIDGEALEFSDGFTDLHTRSYEEVLKGSGFGLKEVEESIKITHLIRNSKLNSAIPSNHPFQSIFVRK